MFPSHLNEADEFESWIGVDEKYRWVSPSVEKLTGYTPSEIMAMPNFAALFIALEERYLPFVRLQKAISGVKGEVRGSLDLKCIHRNGSAFWIQLSWEQIFDAKRQPLGIRTNAKNINDLKVSEEERLLPAIDPNAISQGAPITGADRLIISENDALNPTVIKSTQLELGVLNQTFARRFPLKILVVEDNLINLKVSLKMLQNLGYEDVLSATSGEGALELLESEKADLIFMDLHMPGIDGIETTKIIRSREQKNPSGDPVQILALTANLMPSIREKCFDAGMNYYVGKPFNTRSLAEGIAVTQQNKPT